MLQSEISSLKHAQEENKKKFDTEQEKMWTKREKVLRDILEP